MPDKNKGFKQKSVSVYIGRGDQYISRAVTVLALKENMSESELLKECFRDHCETIGILRSPKEEGQKERWNKSTIEALEAKFGPAKRRKLSKEVLASDNDEDDEDSGPQK